MQVERRPIRVMLVEDHNLVRAGIRAVIDGQSDIQVIAEATEGREAIRLARANCPDVAVVDVAMPGMSGIEVTRDIRRLCPQTQVLILTAHDNEEYFFQTLKAGAVGYVLKKAAASHDYPTTRSAPARRADRNCPARSSGAAASSRIG